MRLIFIETGGKQRYIFGTNKLRENMGASEAIYAAGKDLVERSIKEVLASLGATVGLDLVVATSGKALLLLDGPPKHTETLAQRFVRTWSLCLAKELPGVDALGVWSDDFDLQGRAVVDAMRVVHQRHEHARGRRRALDGRFPRLPIVDTCRTSGLPAEEVYLEGGKEVLASGVTTAKRRLIGSARKRFSDLLEPSEQQLGARPFHEILGGKDLGELLDRWSFDWLGVVHADGNGLGRLFLGLHDHVTAEESAFGRAYLDLYRELSRELDRATREAFRSAAYEVFHDFFRERASRRDTVKLPVVPIIVAGDDLTVVCDGRRALAFARAFLRAFEARLAGADGPHVLRSTCERAFGTPRLGMSVGIAIVKPTFPFFTAYALAEDLCRSAKSAKDRVPVPCSALDFHIVHDTSVSSLDAIRDSLTLECGVPTGPVRLFAKPYVTTDRGALPSNTWVDVHHIDHLDAAVRALRARGSDGRPALPSAQAHAIRSALRSGVEPATEAFTLACARYGPAFAWEGSLFTPGTEGGTCTRFQDALEGLGFLPEGAT